MARKKPIFLIYEMYVVRGDTNKRFSVPIEKPLMVEFVAKPWAEVPGSANVMDTMGGPVNIA